MNPEDLVWILIQTGQKLKLSTKDLVVLTGYDEKTIMRWHRVRGQLSVFELIAWANAVGLDITITKKIN